MKTTLNQAFVLRLDINQKPEIVNGKIVYRPNDGTPYYVFDDHQEAPVGFGVKVQKTKKVYIIQRKVNGSLIKSNVGNVSDFAKIDFARDAARSMVEIIKKTKRNPNAIQKQMDMAELTVKQVFENYKAHLAGRQPPVKPNSLKALNKAIKKLDKWSDRRIKDLSANEILTKFDEIAESTRTTAEQTFRWMMRATDLAIEQEAHDAATQKREATLDYSPFEILRLRKKFRSNDQLEREYKANGVRNPLSIDKMGDWLNAIWKRRTKNTTGGDYMLCCTLWGTRKSEAACLKWRSKLTDEQAAKESWVDLDERKVFFRDTKNNTDHELPLGTGIYELLKRRYEAVQDEHSENPRLSMFVFPAESKYSKTGHYSSVKSLMGYTRDDAGISRLTPHDLRRTFASIAEDLGLPYTAVKRLLNHKVSSRDATGKYVHVEWVRLCEYMQRIEDAMLMKSETVYNALKPIA